MSEVTIRESYAFADIEQYPNSELVRVIREGEVELNACDNQRQKEAINFMVKCAVFEYHQRKYVDGTV